MTTLHVDLTAIPAGAVCIAYGFGVLGFETAVVVLLTFASVYSGPP